MDGSESEDVTVEVSVLTEPRHPQEEGSQDQRCRQQGPQPGRPRKEGYEHRQTGDEPEDPGAGHGGCDGEDQQGGAQQPKYQWPVTVVDHTPDRQGKEHRGHHGQFDGEVERAARNAEQGPTRLEWSVAAVVVKAGHRDAEPFHRVEMEEELDRCDQAAEHGAGEQRPDEDNGVVHGPHDFSQGDDDA